MKRGFDKRLVDYEKIHNIKPEDEEAMINAINPKSKEKILDAFAGYGAVGKGCLKREANIELWINEESEVQMKRAKENLPNVPKERFILGDFIEYGFQPNYFDKVVIKMGLHEVPKKEQVKVAKKVFQILKSAGKLIVWDIMLNEETQKTFQEILRKKDELAGFNSLVKNRYFFREDEFLETIKKAGFSETKKVYHGNFAFSSKVRLESELNNDKKKLTSLNEFIRKKFPERLKKDANFEDDGEDIRFNVNKIIYVMKK